MFDIGERIIIHRPEDTSEHPIWTRQKDNYDCRTCTVDEIRITKDHCLVKVDGLWFNEKWCEKAPIYEETMIILNSEDRKKIIDLIVIASRMDDDGLELGKIAEIVLTKEERKELIEKLIGNLAISLEDAIFKKEAK